MSTDISLKSFLWPTKAFTITDKLCKDLRSEMYNSKPIIFHRWVESDN